MAVDTAGRVFTFTEKVEESLVSRMRDLDEILLSLQRLYPESSWTRQELLTLFFLDDINDNLVRIGNLLEKSDSM